MYVFFFIFFLILFFFFCIYYWKRKKIMKKIRSLCTEEKCQLLNELIKPFGYAYLPSQDLFSSQLDAWQRNFGYGTVYDRTAFRLRMIFDSLPIYFNYHNKTWLIEFWKGQYGINTGAEAGIYYTDHILEEDDYDNTIFQSVSNPDMPIFSFQLFSKDTLLAELSEQHWWLTAFSLGLFSEPKDLTMKIGVTLRSRDMRNAFLEGLLKAGYQPQDIQLSCNTVIFPFIETAPERTRFTRFRIRFAQWQNRFWCNVYLWVTKPFSLSLDRTLYLYYFLPYSFRRILRIRKYKTKKVPKS